MSLTIPQNKAVATKRKSILAELKHLANEGIIEPEVFEHFHEKIEEGGELNLAMNSLNEKDKFIKSKLRNTKEYKDKIEVAKHKKFIKAMQEKNLDETRGAIELIVKQHGNKLSNETKNILSM